MGPGKHDELCSYVRSELGMKDTGAVILIVLGDGVDGFSCQADLRTTLLIPDLLEKVAAEIREDFEQNGDGGC
jgi:hypothetical protein